MGEKTTTTTGRDIDLTLSITAVSVDTLHEQPPGTRLLVDSQKFVSESHQEHPEILLIPRPSNDPDDPLNWSPLRKYTGTGIVCLWTLMLGAATLSPGVTYGAVIMDLGFSIDYLNTGAAVMILMLGTGNLIFNPLALRFGRRPVYLFSANLATASLIIMASAKNKHVHTGGRILLGFAASPFEQLPAVTVADLFFVHHRGWGLSLYVFALSTGSLLGPTATGFVIETLGWRWVYWFYSIFMGAIVVIMFFGLEETGFDRPRYIPGAEDGNSSTQKRPYATKLRLASKFEVQKSFLGTITGPFRLMTEPIIAWSGIMYGFGIAWLSVMATTAFTTFQSPVYNFTFGQMGLTNLSPLIGSYISLYAGGAGADRFMLWKASRNGGVMEPESRIFSVFIAGPVMALGLFLYGIGASYSIHWIGPVIGMGFIGAALPITGEVALGYTSESYPVLTGEATTAVILIRNLIGCGMTFAINPWIERNGLRDTFIVAGILAFVVFMSGALFIWQGKNCRRRAAKMYRSMTTEVT